MGRAISRRGTGAIASCWVERPDADQLLGADRPPPRALHLPHPRGVAPRARRRPHRVRPVVAPRRRHRHVGHQPRTAARRQGRVPGHHDDGRLRLHRGAPGAGARRPRALHQPVLRRSSRAWGRTFAPTTPASCGCSSPLLFSGYLDDNRRPPRPRWSTAGTAPATWSSATTTATSLVVGRTRDLIRTGGETIAPVEVEAALLRCSGRGRRRGGRRARRRLGRGGDRLRGGRRGAGSPSTRIQAAARHRLARHKLPRRLVLVTEIPRTGATGQVGRARLVAVAQERRPARPTNQIPRDERRAEGRLRHRREPRAGQGVRRRVRRAPGSGSRSPPAPSTPTTSASCRATSRSPPTRSPPSAVRRCRSAWTSTTARRSTRPSTRCTTSGVASTCW